jgi:hypothetical protein
MWHAGPIDVDASGVGVADDAEDAEHGIAVARVGLVIIFLEVGLAMAIAVEGRVEGGIWVHAVKNFPIIRHAVVVGIHMREAGDKYAGWAWNPLTD